LPGAISFPSSNNQQQSSIQVNYTLSYILTDTQTYASISAALMQRVLSGQFTRDLQANADTSNPRVMILVSATSSRISILPPRPGQLISLSPTSKPTAMVRSKVSKMPFPNSNSIAPTTSSKGTKKQLDANGNSESSSNSNQSVSNRTAAVAVLPFLFVILVCIFGGYAFWWYRKRQEEAAKKKEKEKEKEEARKEKIDSQRKSIFGQSMKDSGEDKGTSQSKIDDSKEDESKQERRRSFTWGNHTQQLNAEKKGTSSSEKRTDKIDSRGSESKTDKKQETGTIWFQSNPLKK